MQNENDIYKCPHCNKCVAISEGRDNGFFVALHKTKPAARVSAFRTLTRRKCPHTLCRKYFIVENYADIESVLRWLIFNDPNAIARGLFENNPDLITKLRQDKKFMALINDETYDK